MPNVIHECPADGSEHTTSDGLCACGPVRVGRDEHGNELWRHHGSEEQFVRACASLSYVTGRGADAAARLGEALAGVGS